MSEPPLLGITPPLSLADPSEKDVEETARVIEVLNSLGIFEDDEGMIQRREALEQLEIMAKDWIREIAERKNYPPHMAEQIGGKIFTFGSYRLGVNAKGADVDALLVAPRFVERADFFQDFYEKLRVMPDCCDIHCVVEAFVPVLKMNFMKVDIDLLFAKLDMQIIPEDIDLRANTESLLRNLDERCVRSLNGCRVTDEILAQVPDADNFRTTLKVVRIWAKNHGIYSNALGFLGGVSWALLVARICQLYPKALPNNLIMRFFHVMCMWNWPKPVELCDVTPPQLSFTEWDPRTNVSDQYHMMPIITPVFPRQNSTFNVGVSSKTVIMREMEQAKEMVQSIMFGKKAWRDLLTQHDNFFATYKHFVVVLATSKDKAAHADFQGLVESQLRKLVRSFEHNNGMIAVAQILTKRFHKVRVEEADHITKWIVGIEFQKSQADGKLNVDLTYDITSFIKGIKSMTNHNPAHELDVVYQRRRDLRQHLPAEEHGQLSVRSRPRLQDNSPGVAAAAARRRSSASLSVDMKPGGSPAAPTVNGSGGGGAADLLRESMLGLKCDMDALVERSLGGSGDVGQDVEAGAGQDVEAGAGAGAAAAKRPHSPPAANGGGTLPEATPLKRGAFAELSSGSMLRTNSASSILSQDSVASVCVTLDDAELDAEVAATATAAVPMDVDAAGVGSAETVGQPAAQRRREASCSPEMLELSLEMPLSGRTAAVGTMRPVARAPIQKNIKLRLSKKPVDKVVQS